ncbi:MAG: methyltransferase domain-containing protein [Bacteroidota bacterium]
MMKGNKPIDREGQSATVIFDNRSLATDYRTLRPLLQAGMNVLDIGCGTGAISKDIANIVGEGGKVVGIDNTERFILSGRATYQHVENLELWHADLFSFESEEAFDLIVAARVLQWLNNPVEALVKMKTLLKPNGKISILDYNHETLEWNPAPPASMQVFYDTFLRWRSNAALNNRIADDLAAMMQQAGLRDIQVTNSDEYYHRGRPDFKSKVGIWSHVASSRQLVKEGYLDDALRLRAIQEYDHWVEHEAVSMTMKLNEVRGSL